MDGWLGVFLGAPDHLGASMDLAKPPICHRIHARGDICSTSTTLGKAKMFPCENTKGMPVPVISSFCATSDPINFQSQLIQRRDSIIRFIYIEYGKIIGR